MSENSDVGGLGPISRESTASVIAKRLRDAMEDGTLEPGTQLTERDLAFRMRVSRGPLREATQRLIQEGLLRSEHNRGLFVMTFEPDDVYDIYLARTAIERAAVAAILDLAPADTAKRLAKAHRRMATAAAKSDLRALSDADLSFHEILVDEARSPRLKRMHDTLLVETRMCIARLEDTYGAADQVAAEHGAIVEAIGAGDRDRLNELITAHANDALARLIPDTPDQPDRQQHRSIGHL